VWNVLREHITQKCRSFPRIRKANSLTLERSAACQDWQVVGDENRGRRVFTRNPSHHGGVPRCTIAKFDPDSKRS
jgi:hypothetical protein